MPRVQAEQQLGPTTNWKFLLSNNLGNLRIAPGDSESGFSPGIQEDEHRANGDADDQTQKHRQEKEPHVAATLAVGTWEQQPLDIISRSSHIYT